MKSKPEISPYSRVLAGKTQKIHERYGDVIQTKIKKMDALKLEYQKKIEAKEDATFAPNLSARAPLKGESMGLNDSSFRLLDPALAIRKQLSNLPGVTQVIDGS